MLARLKDAFKPNKLWQKLKNTKAFWTSISGFFVLNLFFVWLKTYINYHINFSLGVQGPIQDFLLFLNPIPTAIILLGIALYFRGKVAYILAWVMNLIQTIWLFANILYYREFSDFLSFGIMGSGSSTGNNLGKSIAAIIRPTDFLVYVDLVVMAVVLLFKLWPIDKQAIQKRYAILTTVLGIVLMLVDFGVASVDRSGLLTRSFDNNYIVKYLGLNEYAAFNAWQTNNQNKSRKEASAADLQKVQDFLKQNSVPANISYTGTEKGKNVFVIHLESFQQFLIDYKVDGREVTPNLNAFYHDQNTLSFDNFYNQVGQGKTSDAEMMQENSLYGLSTGSAMTKYGSSNTFEAIPAILGQQGYTSAAFHGDVPTFWNRNNTYKSFGYNYFFSKNFYKDSDNPSYNVGYGMKDKIFLKDTAQYIEQLPQPFYAKLITVTNHYPYEMDKEDTDFPATKTGDNTVDGYVQTAHYLDEAFGELMAYLKQAGLYDNSVFVLYGDHYGISENHKPAIAKLLGKSSVSDYDLAQFQKVPFMIHATGLQGGINDTYGGEIDMMPTLMNLLGVSTDGMTMFGHDLLSTQNPQIVAFRDGDWTTPTYTKYKNQYFDSKTGQKLSIDSNPALKATAQRVQSYVDESLSNSDKVITGDLLRFDKNRWNFHKIDKKSYDYTKANTLKALKASQSSSPTSILALRNGQSTVSDYKTDAPELK
ncbi:LTA synthase family protein [Fructobacillus evanidus]|uniref:AlkP superfamily (MdoB) n=1 Tax=Fructobacillus evanidus TaxID=3064281 RepID=A0ABN9YRK4_9LACO|nr:AlkP superfamily (MdoB) [Fructobacillus sp. LMG 32999]CAK1231411.1 AlkP superfamily (MdoB) [Fructobacillus sp. LMG 32999]CAK1233165.1 AlkP superfamily (MdoB) [Fructobacillus sp. LMG 32999]CAK1235432.1 AlkP superfamily (MdoB) [Fructobacillus sp. LMG 32999]CAK1239082.1 AlkP superfamily (MdoB) [Fructobacillus sp. LMG 32999]